MNEVTQKSKSILIKENKIENLERTCIIFRKRNVISVLLFKFIEFFQFSLLLFFFLCLFRYRKSFKKTLCDSKLWSLKMPPTNGDDIVRFAFKYELKFSFDMVLKLFRTWRGKNDLLADNVRRISFVGFSRNEFI